MADYDDRLKDYVTVDKRITAFYTDYPDGSLQSEIVTLTDKLVVVKAYAYRSADDPRPGIGHSQMEIPGSTPYTEGSEVENAETHAWGRALAALGFEVKKGVATRDEIQGKQHETRAKDGDCPRCGTVGTIRKGREEYGGGWFCDKRKGGCGANFKEKPEPLPGPDPADTFTPPSDGPQMNPFISQNGGPVYLATKEVGKLATRFAQAKGKNWDVLWKELLTNLHVTKDTMTRPAYDAIVAELETSQEVPDNAPPF